MVMWTKVSKPSLETTIILYAGTCISKLKIKRNLHGIYMYKMLIKI